MWVIGPMPLSVAAWSKGCVYSHSVSGIVGLNPNGGMDVCLLWVLCVVKWRSVWWAKHLSRWVLLSVMCMIKEPHRGSVGPLGLLSHENRSYSEIIQTYEQEEHWFSCTAIILTSSHSSKPQNCWWLAPAKPISRQNHCLIYSRNGKASESVGLAVDRSWWRTVCWNDQLCPLLCLCIWLQGTKSQKPQENTEQETKPKLYFSVMACLIKYYLMVLCVCCNI